MRFGICTGVDGIALAAAAGYDYVEMSLATVLPRENEAAFAPVRAALAAAPLRVEAFNCFIPGDLKVTGPAADPAALAQYMDVALRRASEVGASIVVFGSGAARRAPDDFPLAQARAQYRDTARLAGETAAKYGITIALEPLTPRQCNHFNLVCEGAAIVDAVQHPNLRLLADLFHMVESDEPLSHIIDAGARLVHTHLATPSIPETDPQGVPYDVKGYLAALADAGYDARLSVEDNPGTLGKSGLPRETVIRAVLAYTKSCLPVAAQ